MKDKKLRNDIILVVSLLLIAVVALVVILSTRKKDNLIAKVYVQNEVVEIVDLSTKEEKEYQDCVYMGYVSETNRPIICAYNAVYIVIEGVSDVDVEIG